METKALRPVIKKLSFKSKAKFVSVVKVPANAGDMVVMTKVKNLLAYIFQVTQNSPKKYRLTFVNRIQNIGLDIVENLYRANDINLATANQTLLAKRTYFQSQAMTSLKLLEYFALLSQTVQCITFKHYEQIAKQGAECMILLSNWMQSDKKKIG